MGIRWKKDEKQSLLTKLVKEHLPLEQISLLGRTAYGIRRMAIKMRLVKKTRSPPWSRRQKSRLRKLHRQGFSTRHIAQSDLLGNPRRSANGIQRMLGKLILTNQNRSAALRTKKVWQNGEKEKFDYFLLCYSGRFTYPLSLWRLR